MSPKTTSSDGRSCMALCHRAPSAWAQAPQGQEPGPGVGDAGAAATATQGKTTHQCLKSRSVPPGSRGLFVHLVLFRHLMCEAGRWHFTALTVPALRLFHLICRPNWVDGWRLNFPFIFVFKKPFWPWVRQEELSGFMSICSVTVTCLQLLRAHRLGAGPGRESPQPRHMALFPLFFPFFSPFQEL